VATARASTPRASTSVWRIPTDWAASTTSRAPASRQIREIRSTSVTKPGAKETVGTVTIRVRSSTAAATASGSSHAPSRGATVRTSISRLRAALYQGTTLAGCSRSAQRTTRSPGRQAIPPAIIPIPSVTFLVNAISSGSAFTSRAKRARVSSTRSKSPSFSHPSPVRPSRYAATASRTGTGMSPRWATFMKTPSEAPGKSARNPRKSGAPEPLTAPPAEASPVAASPLTASPPPAGPRSGPRSRCPPCLP